MKTSRVRKFDCTEPRPTSTNESSLIMVVCSSAKFKLEFRSRNICAETGCSKDHGQCLAIATASWQLARMPFGCAPFVVQNV